MLWVRQVRGQSSGSVGQGALGGIAGNEGRLRAIRLLIATLRSLQWGIMALPTGLFGIDPEQLAAPYFPEHQS